MPAAYSGDLRERVVGSVEAGRSRRRAAGVSSVSVSTAVRWMQRVAETGSCALEGFDPSSGGCATPSARLLNRLSRVRISN